MAQTIKLKRSSVAGNVPGSSDLSLGEIALNTADGAVYIKKGNNDIVAVADNDILHIDTTNSRVGLGTTSPSSVLHVIGGSATIPTLSTSHPFTISNNGNSGMSIISSGTTNAGQVVFGDADDADIGRLRYDHSDDSMRFLTNASEQARIDSSGNLLVGKTATGTANGIQMEPAGAISLNRDGSTLLYLNRKTSDGTIIDFRKDGTTVGAIKIFGSQLYIENTSDKSGLRLETNAILPRKNQAMANGTVGLGNSAYRFSTLYLSGTANVGGLNINSAYTFPTADGSANQVLQTDGSGNLTFAAVTGSSGVTVSNNVNNRVLTGDGTNANAEANLTFDGTTLTVANTNGNATIGAQNAGGFHIYTDRPRFYFNKRLSLLENILTSYNNNLQLQTQGATKLTLNSAGIDVTGNIVVSGTVDGRDVATDGTKLDTIETSATADQSAAEILTALKTVDVNGTAGVNAGTVDGFTASSAATASTVAVRDSAKDLKARLFRSEYTSTNSTTNYIMTQVATGTGDNYIRPSTPAQIRAGLGIEAGATADQTQAEINALGITATGLSGTPNVTVGNITTTGYLRGPSTFTIDPATHGDDTGTLVIAGNLQVDGTTTTINSTTLTVDDKLLTLASGSANAAAANGAGIEVDISGVTNPSLTYDGTNDAWSFNKNVGIGTASPQRKLEVVDNILIDGASGADLYFRPHTSYSLAGNFGIFTTGLTSGTYESTMTIKGYGSGVNDVMTIKGLGNVGIGDDSPNFKLAIRTPAIPSGSTYAWPLDLSRANADNRGLSFGVGASGGPHAIGAHNGDIGIGQTYGTDSNGLPQFYETLSIVHDGTASAGNVGIGTTSPSQKLQVTGNIAVSGTVDGVDIAARNAILTSTTTTAGAALPKAGGTMTGNINMDSNELNNVELITFANNELTDFSGSMQMILDANDGDGNVPGHGDVAGTYPFGIYFTGDNDSATTTLGNGLVKVWHTGHFNKAHIDYFVGLYNTGVTTTEYDYLDGVTSNIQTQLNSKLSTSGTAAQATNLNATDDRDVAPEDLNYTDDLRIFFTTKEGLEAGSGTGSNYQDAIYLNSYTDGSGGDANLLAFDKSEKKIYHYQADQAATNWGTAKTLAYTDSNITGTAAGLTGTPNISVGNITVSGTVDGVDIASRNGVLTSTTTTANAALPKAGGTMTGNIAHASNFTIDAGGDIILDADGGDVILRDAGAAYGKLSNGSGSLHIVSQGADNDIKFYGNDGGSSVLALRLDMSAAGAATFNGAISSGGITSTGNSTFSGVVGIGGTSTNSNYGVYLQNNKWYATQYSSSHDVVRMNANTTGGLDIYNQTDSGYANVRAGSYNIDSTTVIDASKNLTNIGTITGTGRLYINQPSSNTANDLIIMRANDIYADQVWTDNSGSIRLRTTSGAFKVFTGGSADSPNASGSSENFSINSSGNATFAGTITSSGIIESATTGTGNAKLIADGGGAANVEIDRGSTSYHNNLLYRTAGVVKWRIWQSGADNSLAVRNEATTTNVLSFTDNNSTFAGTVTATGGNSTNWNTAYGWGNHASASYATESYVGTAINNLIDGAPGTLNTLNELAAAVADNNTFFSTVLPKSGGAMTGPITTNSTFDGVDIATRDAVLTSTTTTANAALPKAGGTMSGSIAMANNNITGVNQLEINDPGEGIVFKAGSSGDMQLRILDDASDNILQYSGTNAVFDVQGTITATAKSFDIEHPSKKGMRLKHGVVEGPEHSVYVRGKSKEKVILLPDYWVDLIHKDTITVQLTAIGSEQDLYVEDIKDNKVFVNGDNYFYYVQAERKDVDRFEVEYESNL